MGIPRSDNDLMVWLNNFNTAFAAHAAALGFPDAEVNSLHANTAMVNYLVGDLVPSNKSAYLASSNYKDLILDGPVGSPGGDPPGAPVVSEPPLTVPPGIVPRLRNLIKRIQLSPNYTEAIGLELGIVGPEGGGPSAPAASPKPTLKARSNGPGTVQVDFTKGKFDGVLIESRRAGEDGWRTFGPVNYSPYIDDRPPLEAGKPELREYRARYILRDQTTGDWSDVVTATFVP